MTTQISASLSMLVRLRHLIGAARQRNAIAAFLAAALTVNALVGSRGSASSHMRIDRSVHATSEEIEQFFQTHVPPLMGANHLPGVAVSVARGGTIAYSHGFGFADIDTHKPMDPTRTLVRIASIAKLFTWTAVMQQVERGHVSLEADVNDYLQTIQIPGDQHRPVTLTDLMSHTAGFEVIGRRPPTCRRAQATTAQTHSSHR
jgi:CubicO group peptidase (beta-lactamase class C family)